MGFAEQSLSFYLVPARPSSAISSHIEGIAEGIAKLCHVLLIQISHPLEQARFIYSANLFSQGL